MHQGIVSLLLLLTLENARATITVLELAWEAGHRNVCLQVDCRAAGLILSGSDDVRHQYARERLEFEKGNMWVFYLISLPLTLGMVVSTLRYFAGPEVPRYVLFTVGYTWFCSLSIIILVPADIWTVLLLSSV
ncbi:hypothetical protein LINPERHAP2_LOCUS36286 [Linum perenne]